MTSLQTLGPSTLYIGTYGEAATPTIYMCSFDQEEGAISLKQRFAGIENASFLTIHPSGKTLYAVSEVGETHGEPGGAVYALSIAQDSGELEVLGYQLTHGNSPCYVSVSAAGSSVYVSNYMGGNSAVFPIEEDGSLMPASDILECTGEVGPNQERQEKSHAHSIKAYEKAPFVYITDLGTDTIHIYAPSEDDRSLIPSGAIKLQPGAGPRHAAFHKEVPYAYVVNELHNTVTVMAVDQANGSLTPVQTVSSLPADYEGFSISAEVVISPCGGYLYVSNRGHNSIAVFSIDKQNGEISIVQHVASGGNWPRNFVISPDGGWLLVAHQESDSIIFFKRDRDTGILTATDKKMEVSKPVCLRFFGAN